MKIKLPNPAQRKPAKRWQQVYRTILTEFLVYKY